ncbi:MAG: PEGA domain-containing protein [Nitrospiraceae bacterium]
MRALSLSLMSLLIGTAAALSGCGSWVHGDHQSVRIFSTPNGATVTVDNRIHTTTVGTVNLSHFEDHTAVFEKEGYEPLTLKIERHMSNWVWANLGCLLFVYSCIQVDREGGGFWTFDDDIHVTLTKRGSTVESTAPAAPVAPPPQPPTAPLSP